jgi:hypothetical protein
MEEVAERVVIGMDPHKRSVTIEVMTADDPPRPSLEPHSRQLLDTEGCHVGSVHRRRPSADAVSVGPGRIEHMFDTQTRVTAPAGSAAAVLADAVSERQVADAAEARLLERAATWADLHPPESLHDAAAFPALPGSEHEERIAGLGCPLVAEFCIPELAAALGMSTTAGKRLVGHALELRHRLPRLWARVQAGQVQAWRARRVAEATIHADLTPAGAGFVDRMVTPFASTLTTAALDRVIAEALQRFTTPTDPNTDPDATGPERDSRFVSIDDPISPYGGNALLRGELDPADARDLETAVAARAHQLADDGCTAPLPVRRSMALADLARQQNAFDLTHPHTQDAPVRPKPARQVVLHVHLSAAVTGDGAVTFDRLATLEAGQQQVLLDQVKTWCATSHTTVTLRPVLDLAAQVRCRGYTPSELLRELVIERDRSCVFPWCPRPARSCQLDHITPYDPDNPEAGTHPGNLACLCTFHHRLKTHGGWRYTTTAPGEYAWTSPHGHHYARDHTGTRHLPRH